MSTAGLPAASSPPAHPTPSHDARQLSPRPEVAAYSLDDEWVLYDERTGEAFVLNAVAGYLWQQLADSPTVERLAEVLVGAFGLAPAHARTDVREFVAELHRNDLLTVG